MSKEEDKFKHSKRLLKDENAIKKQVKIAKEHRINEYNPKDLERIRKEWDIPDFKMLDTNPQTAIGASQKLAYDLFMSVGILTKNRLNLHQRGEAKFPIEQIKALKLLYEIYAPLMGVSELVSPNAAIKSLESYGYNLEGLKKVDYETTD